MKDKKKKFNWKSLGKVLVCIDAANLENSAKDLGWWIDYKKLYKFFKKHTSLIEIRHYCPWFGTKNHNGFLTVLKKIGIKLITKPLKIIKEEDIKKGDIRKANFDVEIAIDAIELIKKYDTLVLFSGDSDFDYLLKALKQMKKKVLIISTRHHVSRELVSRCSFYIDLKNLKVSFQRKRG